MEDILLLPKSGIITGRKIWINFNGSKLSPEIPGYNNNLDNLIREGGENFFIYLRALGLANEPNLMVLSTRHNNYYDFRDLKGVGTLINLVKLNRMRHLISFLVTVSRMILPETNFIGCFSDKTTSKQTGLYRKNDRIFNNYSCSEREIQFCRDDIAKLLESIGFNICDMTDIKGLTYFMTKTKIKSIE
jgi:hypothetical protein